MNAISIEFNTTTLSSLKNLTAVLGYIRGKQFQIEDYITGKIPALVEDYIHQLQEQHGLTKEEILSNKTIQLINQLWIQKKYQDTTYIKELHQWLQILGYVIEKEELVNHSIDFSTKQAIEKAEQKYDLQITGEMSLSLENRLRTAYQATISRNTKTEKLQITDINRLERVVGSLSLNQEGSRVQHLQLALAWLGYEVHKEEYRQATFGKQTRLALIAYQKDHQLAAVGALNRATTESINEELLISKPDLLDDKKYRVRGSVKDENWQGIEGITVLVYEFGLRGKLNLLAEKTTAKNGFYDIVYSPPIDQNTQQKKECFHIAVHFQQGDEVLKELTFFNVLPTTWANHTIGATPYQGLSVYEENLKLLTPHLEGLAIAEIEESEKNRDVSYLNACGGIGGKEIMLLSLAHRIAVEWEAYQIHPSIIYSFFKQHLPLSLPSYLLPDEPKEWALWIGNLVEGQAVALGLMPKDQQESALNLAIERHLIPIEVQNEIDATLQSLHQIRLAYAREKTLIGKNISLKDIFNYIENLSDETQQKIVQQFSEKPIWSTQEIAAWEAKAVINEEEAAQLKALNQLIEIGQQDINQVELLQNAFGNKEFSTIINRPSDFAKWKEEDWNLLLESNKEEVAAVQWQQRALALAPTIATVAYMQQENKGGLENLGEIATVLDQQQWLDISTIPIEQQLKNSKIELNEKVVEDLKTLQRVQRVSDAATTTNILIAAGVQSAQKAYSLGAAGIANVLQQGGVSVTNATSSSQIIYANAQQQVISVLGVGTVLQLIGNNQLPTNVLPAVANLEELFGSNDTCACAQCRSVYSPAAYLTDLLQWLQQKQTGHQDPVTRPLLYRRPDIEHILLNCKNAHTPLPYIDLVNEVLEQVVGNDPNYIARNTTWDAPTLRVQAEHQLDMVYEQFIQRPIDPTYQPYASYNGFNLWQAQFEQYLSKLHISPYQLVKQAAKYPNVTIDVMAQAAAYWGIPSHEIYDVLNTHYDYAQHATASNNVEQFLEVHQLSYEQLVELLQCKYINGNGVIKIDPIGTCKLADKQLLGLNNGHYNKIWRFLQLWKYTGWQLSELDLVIRHPQGGQGNLQPHTLTNMILISQLQQTLNCSVEACLGLFDTLNTTVWYTAKNEVIKGLYQRVFLAPEYDEQVKGLFDSANLQVDLQNLSTATLNYLAVALDSNVTAVEEVLSLPLLNAIGQPNPTSVKQAAPLEGLTNLYNYIWLTKELGLTPVELKDTVHLLSSLNNSFQSLATLQTFLQDLKQWQQEAITKEEVTYLLEHQGAENFLSNATIEAWQTALEQELQDYYSNIFGAVQSDRITIKELLEETGRFESEKELEEFLLLLEDDNNYTGSSNYLAHINTILPLYLGEATVQEQNTLKTPMSSSTLLVQDKYDTLKIVLHRIFSKELVQQFLAEKITDAAPFLGILDAYYPQTTTSYLHYLITDPTAANTTVSQEIQESYQYLYKYSWMANKLGLNQTAMGSLESYAIPLQLLNPVTIPVNQSATNWSIEHWNRTRAYAKFCQKHSIHLADFLAAINNLIANNDFNTFIPILATLTTWSEDDISTIQGHLGWSASQYMDIATYRQIEQIIGWSHQTEESVAVLLNWTTIYDINHTDYIANQKVIANQVKQSLQAILPASEWQQYQEQIQGQIRVQKRNALVAYCRLHTQYGSNVLLSVNELYNYYLIDPAMSACQYTSRIKQAISSVQFFIQRCLMGLEEDINTQTDQSWKQWKWMQNYRVWEANRKVFLYPENWIEPTLRDNKSELFEQFENKIQQAEVTNENVEKALQEYLVNLHHISNLEMKSICYGADRNTVYVLARTKENPANYYYRKLDKPTATWTAWSKIESGIKGEHPVLQFYNNRLHVFWLEILEKPQKVVKDNPPLASGVTPEIPKFKEIQLAWAILYETGWSPPTLSKQKLIHPWPRPHHSLHLRPRPKVDDLYLDIYVSTSSEFNDKHFYNQFINQYEHLTSQRFDENQAPWHSSSFVFDGFVREIRLKPITGTYWYVGWGVQSGQVTGGMDVTVMDANAPLWVDNLINTGTVSTGGIINRIGVVHTNRGSFDFAQSTDLERFNNVLNNTRTGLQHHNLDVYGTIYDTNDNTAKFIVRKRIGIMVISIQAITKEQLNSFVKHGAYTPFVPKPTVIQTIPVYQQHLVSSSNPNNIVKIESSDSHEYVTHMFGKDGRQIKRMYTGEQEALLRKPNGHHYDFNHIVPNGSQPRHLTFYTGGLGNSFEVDIYEQAFNYKLSIPMDGNINRWNQFNDVLYQDEFKSFYFLEANHELNINNNQHFSDYTVHSMYHPYTRSFIGRLGGKGLDDLYTRATQLIEDDKILSDYRPEQVLQMPGSEDIYKEQVSFQYDNGYAIYNWELFFHIPFLIAKKLSENQRFEEAMEWFHYIFNPMGVAPNTPPVADVSKYWITKPFYEHSDADYQDSLIQNLLGGTLSDETKRAIEAWKNNPFQPHLIARMRPVAYQKAVVMSYIDNLVAWGDQLFRQETLESINQAALRYVLAAEILGDRPLEFAGKNVEDKDYTNLRTLLDDFSNASVQVQLENLALWTTNPVYSGANSYLPTTIDTKYFCIPANDKLASYWNLVEDRLFKIRHCMNIDGVVRQLPLFAPPIDPALLVNAQANGISLNSVLQDLSLPKSHYKYRTLVRLAMQFTSEVKALGQGLLSALQSKDAEGMALLQASNTLQLLDATIAIKEQQIEEAKESIKSLELSKKSAQLRQEYYDSRVYMNAEEKTARGLNTASTVLDTTGLVTEGIATALTPIPKIEASVGLSAGVSTEIIDGNKLGRIFNLISSIVFRTSGILSKEAGMAATQGGYKRRAEDWKFQAELAANDIEQIEQQIATSKIRVAIAEKDLSNHLLQIENSKSEQAYLQSKYTNQQLYDWMVSQISATYFQTYQLAYDMARRAEKSMIYELGLPATMPAIVKFGYWDSMKKGLLAGNQLMLAINRMEAAYVEKNSRALELTKHISLKQLTPQSLIALRNDGTCEIELPKWWFDLDYPGHYQRRIKALSISIPCIVGPNTNVNCTLTMLQNTIEDKDGNTKDFYEIEKIATSSAQNDAGVFELNLNGERFLPFEGAGAVSKWRLELPKYARFDYQTISDVVLHMRYTARDGGEAMAADANAAVVSHLNNLTTSVPPVVVLSLKTAFPTAWHRFVHPLSGANHKLDFEVLEKHYPYFSSLFASRNIVAADMGVLLKEPTTAKTITFDWSIDTANGTAKSIDIIPVSPATTAQYGTVDLIPLTPPTTVADTALCSLDFGMNPTDVEEIEDIVIILKYKVSQ